MVEYDYQCGHCGHSWKRSEEEISSNWNVMPEAFDGFSSCPKCGSKEITRNPVETEEPPKPDWQKRIIKIAVIIIAIGIAYWALTAIAGLLIISSVS